MVFPVRMFEHNNPVQGQTRCLGSVQPKYQYKLTSGIFIIALFLAI